MSTHLHFGSSLWFNFTNVKNETRVTAISIAYRHLPEPYIFYTQDTFTISFTCKILEIKPEEILQIC